MHIQNLTVFTEVIYILKVVDSYYLNIFLKFVGRLSKLYVTFLECLKCLTILNVFLVKEKEKFIRFFGFYLIYRYQIVG